MLKKQCLGAALLAAATVSGTAMAGDRGTNTAIGAVLGAAIGASAGGSEGAVIGGVLGAALGSSVQPSDRRHDDHRGYYSGHGYHDNRGYYDNRGHYGNRGYASVTYSQPAPVVVESRPVYYDSPRYYRQPEVIVVEPRRHHRHHRHHGYRDRGYDRGGW